MVFQLHQNHVPLQKKFCKTPNKGCPHPEWMGDGACDSYNNIKECNFDGGDCLEEKNTNFGNHKKARSLEYSITPDESCVDSIEPAKCAFWAKRGQCMERADFMEKYCKKSCNKCLGKVEYFTFSRARSPPKVSLP